MTKISKIFFGNSIYITVGSITWKDILVMLKPRSANVTLWAQLYTWKQTKYKSEEKIKKNIGVCYKFK